VIPIGIGLQRERIRVAEAKVDGERSVGQFYASGRYALTVGRPLSFAGDAGEYELVRAVADQIMDRIRELAQESDRRVGPAQATSAGTLPGPSWPGRFAGLPAPGRDVP
jgi:hypothetical protein